ncbi:phenylalanine--tRNA ligase subunit beta [Tengunoibacter tsumagoiensis]|uniref:Phenylalanine--tRNA ligase beta subunit n=1 Tax=Tengunoibacter tsumagoiensis TaxID=2014871 RepID=A0A402A5P5_9CHLR|nr:phenylalanine--tRNA ligase subunit beta [Tengunoibacter tsumagoiensis]GCE14341.1 phenylalanine--tRNA ligase beta subunit [Tengunoibacter tsumagoiensis]
MRVPLSWLKDYVDITMSPEELAQTLTMAGLEVEAVEYIGKEWGDKIISAQIIHLEKVESSDHLNYTKVNTGSEVLNVICGAPNIQLGDKVPLALPGAQFGDFQITETKKMGYVSQGMLCSPRELGMGNDHSGIYILDPDTELGLKVVDLLGEVVLDFAIKAHRGDLSSIIGIAREVSALTGQPLRLPKPVFQEQGAPTNQLVQVSVEDTELCPRYTARVISNVKLGSSPGWMGRRLLAAGMRPINIIVDITNYVMLEQGQPLHGFDYNLVPEHHIIVRRAHEGEILTTLDDVKRKLTPDMLLIADPTGPTAIAGVMGGAKSEVSEKTTTVLLEAANFKGGNVRRTSTILGLRTDASSRYEKGLDPELVVSGADRAAQLMVELAGGTVHPGRVDHYPQPVQTQIIPFSAAEVEWLTSMKVSEQEIVTALSSLGFEVTTAGPSLQVSVPTYRADIQEGADLVEEVIRILGYDRIPSSIPSGPLPKLKLDPWFEREQFVRTTLMGAGLNEIITYALTSRARMAAILAYPGAETAQALLRSYAETESIVPVQRTEPFDARSLPAVVLANSLSSEMEVLRLTLLSNLLETLQQNSKRNKAGLRFFEIGRRYLPAADPAQLPDERRSIGMALSGPAEISWSGELSRSADFYDLKGAVESLLASLHIGSYRFRASEHPTFHPGRCAEVEVAFIGASGKSEYHSIGVLGEVHPLVQQRYDLVERTYLAELDLERLYAAVPEHILYTPISRQQGLTRDLALVVEQSVPAEAIQAAIRQNGGELLQTVMLFDVYTGEPIPAGKKNLTYSLTYQAADRTLKDTEANTVQEQIIRALNEEFGAVLR